MEGGVPVRPWLSCAGGVICWAACGARGAVCTARLWEAPTGEASLEASVSPSTGLGGIESSEIKKGGREGGKFVVFTVVSR